MNYIITISSQYAIDDEEVEEEEEDVEDKEDVEQEDEEEEEEEEVEEEEEIPILKKISSLRRFKAAAVDQGAATSREDKAVEGGARSKTKSPRACTRRQDLCGSHGL